MYKNNGKQLYHEQGGVVTHIADGDSVEKAHALAAGMNGRSQHFIRDALVTCSPDFHGDKVSKAHFLGRMNGAIDALNKLDQVKKSLFYGRDNNLIAEGQADVSYLPASIGGHDAAIVSVFAVDIIHAILGIATEAGELLEALRNAYNGQPVDWVNLQEELGDIDWYKALLANRGDFTFEECQALIIAKLKTRFADKFSAAEAITRDLGAERQVLEGGSVLASAPLALEPTDPASGAAAVNAVEAKSDAAFALKDAVQATGVDAPATRGNAGNQLHLSAGERDRPFPDEHLARQKIRPEDEEK